MSRRSSRRGCPKNLQQLAAPAAGALREPATKAVEYLLAQPRFQQLFVQASTLAHQQLVDVLENKTGHGIDTGNGNVTLDVSQLLTELGLELGIPQSALDNLPANAGVITIMSSDQLSLRADRGARCQGAERLAARARLHPLRPRDLPRAR